jgi:O-antigen/teichoic acid export membrane protein
LKRVLAKGEFSRNVLTLITGTTIAQAIPVAVSPILARLYSPQDFGVFALYMAVTSILSVVATGRYEQAIMLPREDEDAENVVALSLIISTLISFMLLVIATIWNTPITALLGNPEIGRWLYLVPVSVLLMGAYNSFNYWLNRQKKFGIMSTNRIMQSSLTAAGQLGLGFSPSGSAGLITSFIGGWLVATFSAARFYNYKSFCLRPASIIASAKLYRDYPGLSAPSSLLDSASTQTPVFFLTKGYDAATVGFFSLAIRALSAPSSVISTSIGQVYFQKISVLIHSDPNSILSEVLRTTKKLTIIAAVTFIPFMLIGDRIFGFIFGEDWRVAGEYVEILSPALMMRFIVSPLSTIFLATGNVRLGALWQALYFITTMLVMLIFLGHRVKLLLTGFVINEIVMYTLYFCLIILASKKVSVS